MRLLIDVTRLLSTITACVVSALEAVPGGKPFYLIHERFLTYLTYHHYTVWKISATLDREKIRPRRLLWPLLLGDDFAYSSLSRRVLSNSKGPIDEADSTARYGFDDIDSALGAMELVNEMAFVSLEDNELVAHHIDKLYLDIRSVFVAETFDLVCWTRVFTGFQLLLF